MHLLSKTKTFIIFTFFYEKYPILSDTWLRE